MWGRPCCASTLLLFLFFDGANVVLLAVELFVDMVGRRPAMLNCSHIAHSCSGDLLKVLSS